MLAQAGTSQHEASKSRLRPKAELCRALSIRDARLTRASRRRADGSFSGGIGSTLSHHLDPGDHVGNSQDCHVEKHDHARVLSSVVTSLAFCEQCAERFVVGSFHPRLKPHAGIAGDRCRQPAKRKRSAGAESIQSICGLVEVVDAAAASVATQRVAFFPDECTEERLGQRA